MKIDKSFLGKPARKGGTFLFGIKESEDAFGNPRWRKIKPIVLTNFEYSKWESFKKNEEVESLEVEIFRETETLRLAKVKEMIRVKKVATNLANPTSKVMKFYCKKCNMHSVFLVSNINDEKMYVDFYECWGTTTKFVAKGEGLELSSGWCCPHIVAQAFKWLIVKGRRELANEVVKSFLGQTVFQYLVGADLMPALHAFAAKQVALQSSLNESFANAVEKATYKEASEQWNKVKSYFQSLASETAKMFFEGLENNNPVEVEE